jgi:hypothetical protein
MLPRRSLSVVVAGNALEWTAARPPWLALVLHLQIEPIDALEPRIDAPTPVPFPAGACRAYSPGTRARKEE